MSPRLSNERMLRIGEYQGLLGCMRSTTTAIASLSHELKTPVILGLPSGGMGLRSTVRQQGAPVLHAACERCCL
jgi:hypothetical protein